MTQEAFSELYRAHKHRLVRLAYSRLRDHHLAEDIAQETLLRAFRFLPAGMAENPWPWLSRVAINASEDQRAARREALPGTTKEVVAWERAESAAERREAVAAVQRAIGSLTPIQEQTIRLSHHEERSYAEIASIQGLGVAKVRDRLHYSRQKLKTKLRQFADYPLSALIPAFKFRRLWRIKAARALVKIATLAAVSVTAAGLLGPNHTVPSQAGEPEVRTSIPSDGIGAPLEVATYVSKYVPSEIPASTATSSSTRRDLTQPIEVPSGPSSEGPGSSGGPIGPLFVDCDPHHTEPAVELLCEYVFEPEG